MFLESESFLILTPIIKLTLISIFGLIGLLVLIGIIDKIFKFYTYKNNNLKVQRGELIKKKNFRTSDAYDLRWKGEINKNGQFIIVYIHDIVGSREESDSLIKHFVNDNDISVVSYDQRWYGENINQKDKNFGLNFSDLKEIVDYIHEYYENQKIILIGHGIGASLALACAGMPGIYKVFCGSLKISNNYLLNFNNKMAIFWSWIFSSKIKLTYKIEPEDLSNNSDFCKYLKKINDQYDSISVREYIQSKNFLNYAIKKANKSNVKNIIILQPLLSVFNNNDKLAKKLLKLKNGSYDLETFGNFKHYLFQEENSSKVFNIIEKKIKN